MTTDVTTGSKTRNIEGSVIGRGALAGGIGGLLAFGFARIWGEPVVRRAIAFEEATAEAAAHDAGTHDHGIEVFTRTAQENAGLGIGIIVLGAALGALVAVAYLIAAPRVSLSPRVLACTVAGLGFVGLYLVPILKYPPNPPAVGHADTIGPRTGLFLLMIVVAFVAIAVGIVIASRLQAKRGSWSAVLIGVAVAAAICAIATTVLPGYHEVPEGYSPNDLYTFRKNSLITQAILWTSIALIFAPFVAKTSGAKRELGAA